MFSTSYSLISIYMNSFLLYLANPESPFIKTEIYAVFFTNVLTLVMYPLAWKIYNFWSIAEKIVDVLNEKIGYKYIIYDCKEKDNLYTCGRAISYFGINYDNDGQSTDHRIIVSNTVSMYNDLVDQEYIDSINEAIYTRNYSSDKYN